MLDRIEISSEEASQSRRQNMLIRGLDLLVATIGLLTLSPLFLAIGLIIKLTSTGPIFFIGERVGRYGKLFKLYKFRTTVVDAERNEPGITVNDDPQVTSVGHFLRKTRLDELPQLINVWRGEMSLVGPRPEELGYAVLYTPQQLQALTVRPGITSPASLNYRQEELLLVGDNREAIYVEHIMPHKLAMDIAYLKQRTVWTDLTIILQTINAIIAGRNLPHEISRMRNRYIFLLDLLILSLLPAIALSLRLETIAWWPALVRPLLLFIVVALLVKLPIFYLFGLYNRYWRYAGVRDLNRIMLAVGCSTAFLILLFVGIHSLLEPYGLAIYRTVPIFDGILTLIAAGGTRFGLRELNYWHRRRAPVVDGRRVLIVGAGESGTLVVRELQANPQLNMDPIAFVDDDHLKLNTRIEGLAVVGRIKDIPGLVDNLQIQRIIVALPSAPLGRKREITTLCEQTGADTLNLPGVYEILAGHKTISRVPQIDIHDLLGREQIVVNQKAVGRSLRQAKVLVTGAGGSIGSELCRQIARFDPADMVLLGHGENSIFEIRLELNLSFPQLVTHPVIVNVRDPYRVHEMVKKYQPDIIFHAAAHKHVPFMEASAAEAIINNVLGTKNVLEAAEQNGVDRFVLISTDKAVNPTSIMGATKRLAELMVLVTAHRSGRNYTAVRFGNVLGSRGSVVPVFQRQIAAGGPLTVTHPDMTRYFMTIPEAVQLVLQASILGQGGEIFVLDMGQPVKITDLALNLIRVSGLRLNRDIAMIYSGVRPGEKLHEELFLKSEDYSRTDHPKIFSGSKEKIVTGQELEAIVTNLINLTEQGQDQITNEKLRVQLVKICRDLDQDWLEEPLTSLKQNSEVTNANHTHPQSPTVLASSRRDINPRLNRTEA